jgi:N-acetylneuraminic acid mutarotase
MTPTLRTVCRVATVAALAAIAAINPTRANHYILPCRDDCKNPHWVVTGSLNTPRSGHTATLLQSGKVLVVGGSGDDTAELYDPATGTWSYTGRLNIRRSGQTATLLRDGRVLVAGWQSGSTPGVPPPPATAEVYDPVKGTWSLTGSMGTGGQACHTTTLLQDGKVLVAGGGDPSDVAELYDPVTNAWSATGNLVGGRYCHTATLLEDGKVLVAGGSDDSDFGTALSTATLYDPLTGTWSAATNMGTPAAIHTATLLESGKVLEAGGYLPRWLPGSNPNAYHAAPISLDTAQLYDPVSGTWSYSGSLTTDREGHTATLMPDGTVVVAGGLAIQGSAPHVQHRTLGAVESYDPISGEWAGASDLNVPRSGHTATLLADGRILVAGGSIDGPDYSTVSLASAELYDTTSTAVNFHGLSRATGGRNP